MDDPGHLIATCFVLLYTILGPLVVFAIYVLFDSFSTADGSGMKKKTAKPEKRDPALWTFNDVNQHMKRI